MPIKAWSTTASSNANADVASGINWAEGMAPSAVNDSSRAEMTELAEYFKDNDGTLTTAGTSTVYTVTNSGSFTSLADGLDLSITIDETCGASPTLNVNGLGARKFRKFTPSGEADLAAGDLIANGHYALEYDSAANSSAGAWIVTNLDPRIPSVGILPTPVGIYDPSGTSALDLAFPSGKTVLRITGLVVTSAASIALSGRFSSDGTTFAAGASDYGYSQISNNGTTLAAGPATAAQIALAIGSDSTTIPTPVDILVTAGAASLAATAMSRSASYNTTNDMRNSLLAGRRAVSGAQTHFRLLLASGTFAAGTHLLVEAF
jgi:hypothetical protein